MTWTRNIYFLIWVLMVSAINSPLAAQNCCCDVVIEVEIPGGDFEIAPFPPPGGWIDYTIGQFLGSWEIVTGSVSHHDDGHNNLGNGNPNPSTAHLDLNGSSVGAFCQDISGFIVGQEYELVFYYAIHNALTTASATVEIDGGAALSETWSATNVGSVLWLEHSFNFIATATTMDLCFYSLTNVGCCGMLIDDIKIFEACTEDEEPPEIIMPLDETYQCIDDVPDPIDIMVMDNCALSLEIEFTEEYSGTDFCDVVITRTWTVQDDCGNIATHSQFIYVLDNEPPEIVQPLINMIVGCEQDVETMFFDWINSFGGGVISDECTAVFSTVNYQTPNFEECSETTATFTFSDFCGNVTIETASFEIVDNQAPVINTSAQNLDIACGDNAFVLIDNWLLENAYAVVSDNCSFSIVNDFNGYYDISQAVLFTVTDLCGNQTTYTSYITIDTEVEIIQIDTFTCDPAQAGLVEIFIDNEFCDSLLKFDFVLLTSDTMWVEVTSCDVLAQGLDTLYLTNALLCDSLVIVNTSYKAADTLYNEITTCDITHVGLDTLFLSNANNCDSLVVIHTIFAEGDTLYNQFTTCDITQVGTDTLFLSNANNCDSLVVIQTIFATGDTLYNQITTCDITQVGTDTLFLLNIDNCDSIVVVNTSYSPSDTMYNTVPTCSPLEVTIDTFILVNLQGCDSMVIAETYLVQNDTIFITEYSCAIKQATYNTTIIPGPICDTVVAMTLLPLINDTINLEISTCRLSEVGVFTAYYTNLEGCDSVVISTVDYAPNDTVLVISKTCLLDEVGQDTLTINSEDCDSTIIYATILLEEHLTRVETFTCNPIDPKFDTILYQNTFGCDSLVITTYFYNPIGFDVMQSNDPCDEALKGSFEIININGPSQPFLFSLDGIAFSGQTTYAQLDAGEYTIYAKDINGCIAALVPITINLHDAIEAHLPTQINIKFGADYQLFMDFSSSPDTFYWSDESLVSCTTCLDPFILADQDVQLTLFFVDAFGCLRSANISISVEEEQSDFFIPNIFSPNGDGINDYFHILTNDPLAQLERAEVFDRWGNSIYQHHEGDLSDLKWDGNFNGRHTENGVYIYLLVVVDGKGNRMRFVGDITLVR